MDRNWLFIITKVTVDSNIRQTPDVSVDSRTNKTKMSVSSDVSFEKRQNDDGVEVN